MNTCAFLAFFTFFGLFFHAIRRCGAGVRCSPFAGQNIAGTDPQTRTPFFRKEEK